MATLCPAPDPALGLVQNLGFTVDCNLQGTAQAVYGSLAQPGSVVSQALFGLLTLYVAFIGYRLLLGRSPLRVGELTVSALKIGLVVLMATSWGAYQTVVYDVLAKGPGAVAGSLLTTLQPQQSVFRGDPYQGLQVAFDQLQLSATSLSARAGANSATMQGGPGFAAFGLNSAAYLMLLTTLGASLAARIGLTLLLGLAPLFAAFLLFRPTRGLVEGWLRAAVTIALVPLAAALTLALELVMMEPSLLALAAAREEGRFDAASASAALILSLVFAGALLALGIAVAAIGWGVKLPGLKPAPTGETAAKTEPVRGAATVMEAPPRAAAVAAAAMAAARRDTGRSGAVARSIERRTSGSDSVSTTSATETITPLGRSFRSRAAAPRTDLGAAIAVRSDR